MKNQHIYINGKKVADINGIFPRGIFYGDGVFETMRWKKSPPVFLQKHIERILRGASLLGIPAPDNKKIIKEISASVEKSGFSDCAVKLCLVSGGPPFPFFSKPDSFQTVISVTEISPDFSRDKSLKIVLLKNGYSITPSPLSAVKSLNYLENVLAMREAKENGFDDALFSSTDGNVAETTCRNIFWGQNREIFTPPSYCGILSGITRGVLMDIARKNAFTVSESLSKPEEMKRADFVFATNSLSGMVPVEKIQIQDLTLKFSTSVHNSYIELKNLLYQAFMWV